MKEHEDWVAKRLHSDLENAGIEAVLDRRDNAEIGKNVARFISRLAEPEVRVVVVGTPLYLKKYENRLSTTGSVVAAEVDLINQRFLGTEEEKATVLPSLLDGDEGTSLPPLMRRRVHADFRNEEAYFLTLFDLVLTLYGIPFDSKAVAELRESLSPGNELF